MLPDEHLVSMLSVYLQNWQCGCQLCSKIPGSNQQTQVPIQDGSITNRHNVLESLTGLIQAEILVRVQSARAAVSDSLSEHGNLIQEWNLNTILANLKEQ